MSETPKKISNLFVLLSAFLICLAVILFEATQEYYYIRIFNLVCVQSFFDILLSQTRKWLIWVIYAIPLWWYVKWLVKQDKLSMHFIVRTVVVIIALFLLVIVTISLIETLISGNMFLSISEWQASFILSLFQKAPIYTFGYTLLALVFYLFFKNNELTIELLKFSELTEKDLKDYYENKNCEDQNTSVLKIKVGNTYKIVAVEDIDWIEADDYCVNIHNKTNQAVYSMRASLKSLESLLPESFIRVHRSAIVNMAEVKEYKTQGSGLIKMKSGDEIAVAQSKVKIVNGFFNLTTH
jgi:Response regulator of the LytR/AlgR family